MQLEATKEIYISTYETTRFGLVIAGQGHNDSRGNVLNLENLVVLHVNYRTHMKKYFLRF